MKTTWRDADDRSVSISAGSIQLEGILVVPNEAKGIVLFAHGGGSSLYSTRNRYIAHALHQVGLATLLISLMTHEEEAIDVRTEQFRFDVTLLTTRLLKATDWLTHQPDTCQLQIGYLGDDVAGGAALLAAAEHPHGLGAIVLRSGRTDLAYPSLPQVQVPTLLIVGGKDEAIVAMNQYALSQIRSQKQLEVIPGAAHLFAEPGALAEVARLASQWFKHHFTFANSCSSPHSPAAPEGSDRDRHA